MYQLITFCLVAGALLFPPVEGANIVFFFGVSTYSHRIPAIPLYEALADQGHNITFISPYLAKNPNPKIFDYVPRTIKEWVDSWGDLEDVFADRKAGYTLIKGWFTLPLFGLLMCEEIYKDHDYINWIKTTKVDLVFVDALANDCALGMAHYWGAKVILFETTSAFSYFTDSHGLPDETNWIPNMELAFPADMTFPQRIANKLIPIVWDFYRKWYYFPKLEALTKEKLEMDVPNFEELERNVTALFLNTYFAEEFARSLPPNVISIGGITWTGKIKPLPKDLETFVGNGSGFIYVSFGTYADFTRMDEPVQQAFINAFRSFPNIQFVWKVGNNSLIEEFPDKNVYISKWMPQQDILAHPKIRAFITHAGLLGIQEAIQNAVPLISFPIFAEQDYNAERIHRKEYGIRLEILTVTRTQLEDAINRILNDAKYRNNIKKISTMFTSRPQQPLETALWWTNFVLRHSHEDLTALRPLGISQPWWKKRGVDVWAAVLGFIVFLRFSVIFIIVKLFKRLYGSIRKIIKVSEKQRSKKVQ